MNAQNKSEVSYQVVITILAAIAVTFLVTAIYLAKASNAAAAEKATTVNYAPQGRLSLKDWQLLAK